MTTTRHTPYASHGPLTSAAMEAPLGQLDAAINAVVLAGSATATTLTAQALLGQASLVVASSAGFAVGDPIFVNNGATSETKIVSAVPDATHITVSVNLVNTFPIGSSVSKSPVEIVDARMGAATLRTNLALLEQALNFDRYYSGSGDAGPALVAAVADMEATGKALVFPERVYPITSSMPILLNLVDVNFTYRFIGLGTRAIFRPSGLASGQYIFHANYSAASAIIDPNAIPRHPAIVFEGITFDGVNSTAASVIRCYKRSVVLRRVRLLSMLNGVVADGYTDSGRIEHVHVSTAKTGGFAYKQTANGDGFVCEQLFTTGSGGLSLSNAAGAYITGRNGGWDEFIRCKALIWEGGHMEKTGGVSPAAAYLYLAGTDISIRDSFFWTDPAVPFIQIDDDSAASYRQKSDVLLERVRFLCFQQAATDAFGVAVHLKNFASYSRLRLRDTFAELYAVIAGATRWTFEATAARVTSDVAAIQTALSADPARLAERDVTLYRRDAATWELVGPHNNYRTVRQIGTTPSFSSSGVSTFPSNLAAATYFYRLALITLDGETAKSAEISVVATLNQAIRLNPSLRQAPVLVRVWRGTAADTYTAYVDIVASNDLPEWVDTGATLNGVPWISTGIPTPPTVTSLMDGFTLLGANGRRQFYAGAVPTTTTFAFARGDIIWNNAPSASGKVGWVCTTAGSPGTWKAFGVIDP